MSTVLQGCKILEDAERASESIPLRFNAEGD
jgi:hypothetical protein